MTDEQHFNVLFISGGSGGYVRAIRAAQLGMQVAVIEPDKLGCTCLHRCCNPSTAYPEGPRSVIILGGGVIGVEFASFFNAFGVEVTIIEMLGGLIPMMDEEASKELQRSFSRRGIKIMTNARAIPETVRSTDTGVELEI